MCQQSTVHKAININKNLTQRFYFRFVITEKLDCVEQSELVR